jgi:hypothetical protein
MNNLKSIYKSTSLVEIIVFVLCVIYLILPIQTPSVLSQHIETPLGYGIIFTICVSLFLYSHPILAVLFIFVSYTLLRRSANVSTTSYLQYTPNTKERDIIIERDLNQGKNGHQSNEKPKKPEYIKTKKQVYVEPDTLEEEIVAQMAPIGKSEKPVYTKSSFYPVSSNINDAALY